MKEYMVFLASVMIFITGDLFLLPSVLTDVGICISYILLVVVEPEAKCLSFHSGGSSYSAHFKILEVRLCSQKVVC